MSDDFMLPETPPLVSAVQARNLARYYHGMALHLRSLNVNGEARTMEQRSAWWMAYAVALSQIPPGATDTEGAA